MEIADSNPVKSTTNDSGKQRTNADYRTALDFLYSQLPMFQRVGAVAFKKDLTNTLALCAHLGNPEQAFPSVHIAGTNGKGSVTHLLAAACQAAGLKTGIYVSPHYKDFRERIRINGRNIPKREVIQFVARNKAVITEISPSFFEMCVAMAFDYFAREKVDIAIIEVGLGGRLDSTNVITPLLSVITNISFDHVDMLGNTLPLIAAEKAGIIKPGVPVVIGETQEETTPVFREKALKEHSPTLFADAIYSVEKSDTNDYFSNFYKLKKATKTVLPEFKADLSGPYQHKNIVTAYAALKVLAEQPGFQSILRAKKSAGFTGPTIRYAWENLRAITGFQGRWQVIGTTPTILCDSAHNEAGIQLVMEAIGKMKYQQLHIVTGFVNDKDLSKALQQYPQTAKYYFAKANIPRGMEAAVLQQQAAKIGLHGKAYSSVKNALRAAKRAAAREDLIFVTGSIFVVAEVI